MNDFRQEMSTCCCSFVFRPDGYDKLFSIRSLAALAKSSDKIDFRPALLQLLLLAFPNFSKKELHEHTKGNKENYVKKKILLSSVNAQEMCSCFAVGAKTKPLGASI